MPKFYFRITVFSFILTILLFVSMGSYARGSCFDSTGAYTESSTNPQTSAEPSIELGDLTDLFISGYRVLVTPLSNDARNVATRLSNLGATVGVVNPIYLTSELLYKYDILWIAAGGAAEVASAGKVDVVKDYVKSCGGLIVEQPNVPGKVEVLPYQFCIETGGYGDPCVRVVRNPNHFLTEGLSAEDLPGCFDKVESIGPEWEVLVEGPYGYPSLSVATYGSGRIVVELGKTGLTTMVCTCFVCMEDIMLERMVKWAAAGDCKSTVEIDIKPQTCPNDFNIGKDKGVLPVAILGTEDINVYDIDVYSIRLEGVEAIRSSYEDVAGPLLEKAGECDCTRSRRDGVTDLILKFDSEAIASAVGAVTNGEILTLTLTGQLIDGKLIEGRDCIVVISN